MIQNKKCCKIERTKCRRFCKRVYLCDLRKQPLSSKGTRQLQLENMADKVRTHFIVLPFRACKTQVCIPHHSSGPMSIAISDILVGPKCSATIQNKIQFSFFFTYLFYFFPLNKEKPTIVFIFHSDGQFFLQAILLLVKETRTERNRRKNKILNQTRGVAIK